MVRAVSAQRRRGVLYATVFVDQLGFGIVLPFLPLYADRLGASALEVGLLLAIYSLMQMATSTRWGRLSDRIGRRPVIVASAAGACAGFAILGAADALAWLFAGRALLGAFGVGMATAQAWIADTTPVEERGRALALLGAAGGLGFVAGPALGALGILVGGMRLPFLISAVCAGTNALLATRLPDTRPVHETRPALEPGAWRAILPCLVVAFTLSYSFSNIEATFALFTHDELGFSASDNGWLFVAIGVAGAVTQASGTRWLARKLSEPLRVAAGLAFVGIGGVLIPSCHSLASLLATLALMAIGYAVATPSLTAWVSRRSPADRQGELIGLAQSTAALARVAGPGIGGLLFDHVSHTAPFRIAGVLLVGVAAIAVAARAS
jgi:DHA1 family tetracycline resistance protein-like MFS transporter